MKYIWEIGEGATSTIPTIVPLVVTLPHSELDCLHVSSSKL